MHRHVGEALERAYKSSLDAHIVELAHHFFQSGTPDKAIEYSMRAGDRAIQQVGYEEAALHYARAIEMLDLLDADHEEKRTRRRELHTRRARALSMCGAFESARGEIDMAIALTTSDQERAELLLERATTSQLMFDIPSVARAADEVLRIAKSLERGDLESAGLAWRAVSWIAEGETARSIADFQHALQKGIHEGTLFALAHFPLAQYWTGQARGAVESTTRVLEVARRTNDIPAAMMTLPERALAFACLGRHAESLATFQEARELATRHGNLALLARVISMSTGPYFDLFDYEHAEMLAEEARATVRKTTFAPPLVSSELDLAAIAIRRGDFSRARAQLDDVSKQVENAGSWHGWVWRMRLDELRAEMALGRGDAERAVDEATRAFDRAARIDRPKYRVLSMCTRGLALASLGRDARDDLDRALAEARAVGHPALVVYAMRTSLSARPDESLRREARDLVQAVAAGHPDETTRERFVRRAAIG